MTEDFSEEERGDAPVGSSRHASTALFLGVIAMIASVALVGGILGVVAAGMGYRALRRIRASEGQLRGKGMAMGGMVLGMLAVPAAFVSLGFYLLFPMLVRARRESEIAGTADRMRLILQACREYAVDDNDFFPPSLAPVVTMYSLPTKALRDVRDPAPAMTQPGIDPEYGKYEAAVEAHCDFVYTGEGLRVNGEGPPAPGQVMVLFAKAPAFGRRLIGFADGHVDRAGPEEWGPILAATNEARAARHRAPLPEAILQLPSH